MAAITPNDPLKCNPAWREMARLSEERVRAQLQLTVAADQRATALAGVCASISAGSIAGAGAFSAVGVDRLLVFGLGFLAVGALVAAVLAALAARPAAILPPGIPVEEWKSKNQVPSEEAVYARSGSIYAKHIEWNRGIQVSKYNMISGSLTSLILSSFIFLLLGLFSLR